MKRYDGYLGVMECYFSICVFSLGFGITLFFPLLWIFGIIKVIMGMTQLISGVRLWWNSNDKPDWFLRGLGVYWFATAFYFLTLWLIIQYRGNESWHLQAWLFVVPWIIAIYQYTLVRMLKRDLIRRSKSVATWETVEGNLQPKKFKTEFQ